ncbi:MAG: substrate-binding domain-containing protein [Verrucomicrobia bacterium]|nr:substrate-binding domain-containing protein [Prolixibacteraceae bacterium]
MEYQPNLLASTLASKKTFTFALFIPEPISAESYWNKPLVGIRKAFKEIQHYGVNIDIHLFRQSDSRTFIEESELVLQSQPDGVVLAPFFSREARTFIEELKKRDIPYVFIDSNISDSQKLSYIGQDSFQSGTLAAKLLSYSIPENASILILHFAKGMDNLNHLVQREKGFYEYFKTHDPQSKRKLITLEIEDPRDPSFWGKMDEVMNTQEAVKGIFVTNSQVYHIAKYIEQTGRKGIRIIGHDLLKENIDYLKEGIVDFLICQRPEEQGYNSVYTLFDHVIQKKPVKTDNFTSIDIITKENVDYYK